MTSSCGFLEQHKGDIENPVLSDVGQSCWKVSFEASVNNLVSTVVLIVLQDVVRNWYARLPSIVHNTDALVRNAEECAQAFMKGKQVLSEWS